MAPHDPLRDLTMARRDSVSGAGHSLDGFHDEPFGRVLWTLFGLACFALALAILHHVATRGAL